MAKAFDIDAPELDYSPPARVLRLNQFLQDVEVLRVVLAIKESLAEDDLQTVVMYMSAMPEELASALWLAPTKGGIFTTAEIAKMKSNEYAAARTAYYAAINEGKEQ